MILFGVKIEWEKTLLNSELLTMVFGNDIIQLPFLQLPGENGFHLPND